ncbi:efflux transporter outer membrane subunit [Rubritalea tangerina]|uniref:Efflux transporter outer membrane subunit n=1 Tax=Rubritalea tangerina TaxID=430798 RepID=A0ABW4ZD69_9BACT
MNRPKGAALVHLPLSALILGSLLTSCNTMIVGKNYQSPEIITPDTWHQSLAKDMRSSSSSLHSWWKKFNDPTLTKLVNMSAKANPDVKIALERVVEAQEGRRISRSGLAPTVDLAGNVLGSSQSENTDPPNLLGGQSYENWSTGASASWELDFFGGVRRAIESSDATAEALEEAYRDTLVTLFSEVAFSYIEVRTFEERIRQAQNNIKNQAESVELTQERFEAGLVPELDVSQAQTNLANSRALVPQLRAQRAVSLNRLATLLGKYAGEGEALVNNSKGIPMPSSNTGIGLPTNLLRSRPDIRRAERELAAQTARIGVAEADLYPRFFLAGDFAFQSGNTNNLFNSSSGAYSFGPSFRWNIFSAGRIRSQIKVEESRTRQALYFYEQTVLRGVEDVENSLASAFYERDRMSALNDAVQSAQRTVDLVKTNYKQGLVDFQNVLDAERTIFNSQDAAATSKGVVAAAYVSLYKSLGGGTVMPEVSIQK